MKRLYDKALMEQIAKVYGNELNFLSEFSRALLDIIREGLIRDGEVRLYQFGVFKLKWMNARNGVNPVTGKKIKIQGRPRVIFTPAKALKERIEPVAPELIPLESYQTDAKTLHTATVVAEAVEEVAVESPVEQVAVVSDEKIKSAPDFIPTPAVQALLDAERNEPEQTLEFDLSDAAKSEIQLIVEQAEQALPVEEPAVEIVDDISSATSGEIPEEEPEQAQESTEVVSGEMLAEEVSSLETAEPEESESYVADIKDEIEVLEQVVEILGSESAEPVVAEAVLDEKEIEQQETDELATEEFALEEPVVEDAVVEEPVSEELATEEVASEESEEFIQDAAPEESAEDEQLSQWLDPQVISKIEQLTQQEYLREREPAISEMEIEQSADIDAIQDEAIRADAIQDEAVSHESAEEIILEDTLHAEVLSEAEAREESAEPEQELSSVEELLENAPGLASLTPDVTELSDNDPDYSTANFAGEALTEKVTGQELVALDEASNDAVEKSKDNRRTMMAIAAGILVLFATGLIINTFFNRTSPVSAPEQVVVAPTDNRPAQVDEPLVEESEPLVAVAEPDTEQKVSDEPAVEEKEQQEVVAEQADTSPQSPVIAAETGDVNVIDEIEVSIATEQGILVSDQDYDELKRATAEEDVFFSARDYRLIDGDSLWRLAKKHYVNPFYWPHIYQENHTKILNPDRVKIGRVITLPTLYGHPDKLTKKDRRNIAMGYYYNYLYHKKNGDPQAYFSLIGVDKFYPELLIEYKDIIGSRDVNSLAMLIE